MRPVHQIQARFAGIFDSLAETVLWTDPRHHAGDVELNGYLTKGSGPEGGPEFRFRAQVAGLELGALLRLASQDERWRVDQLHLETMEDQDLFLAARVQSLAEPALNVPQSLEALLAGLDQALAASTLGPLEREDAREALARLPQLCAQPAEPAYAGRIRPRLSLLKDRFKTCPQTWHQAQGLLLKLEAHLKRQGLP